MNFDRLAPFYHSLECLMAGGLMQHCRTTFLPQTRNCQHALLVGEGTGRFLVELLRLNPNLEITCIEHSGKMIQQAKRRLVRARLPETRVQFMQLDVLAWVPPTEKFDLVVTNFLLDCFLPEQLKLLVARLAASATPGAVWLLADFRLPEHGWRRFRAQVILSSLYRFFKLATSLPANSLTPPDPLQRAENFTLVHRRYASCGLLHSDLWKKSQS